MIQMARDGVFDGINLQALGGTFDGRPYERTGTNTRTLAEILALEMGAFRVMNETLFRPLEGSAGIGSVRLPQEVP